MKSCRASCTLETGIMPKTQTCVNSLASPTSSTFLTHARITCRLNAVSRWLSIIRHSWDPILADRDCGRKVVRHTQHLWSDLQFHRISGWASWLRCRLRQTDWSAFSYDFGIRLEKSQPRKSPPCGKRGAILENLRICDSSESRTPGALEQDPSALRYGNVTVSNGNNHVFDAEVQLVSGRRLRVLQNSEVKNRAQRWLHGPVKTLWTQQQQVLVRALSTNRCLLVYALITAFKFAIIIKVFPPFHLSKNCDVSLIVRSQLRVNLPEKKTMSFH